MKIRTIFIAVLALGVLSWGGQSALARNNPNTGRAKLQLSSDHASFNLYSTDPWFKHTWVTNDSNFNLDITNTLGTIDVSLGSLVLAIPGDTVDTGWSFKLGDQTFNYASFTGTGLHPYLSPHGIFAKTGGALWAQFYFGTLKAGEKLSIPFSWISGPQNFLLHFDAFGSSDPLSQNGWYFNPYSHDVTLTPEPISSVLFLTGGLALGMRRFIRKRREGPAK